MSNTKKVIFDTDPGIDDAMALLYLHACPTLELLGITTILGNASIEDCTRNALFLCEQFGIDTPVYRGSGKAVDGSEPDFYPDFVHGANGLGDYEVAVSHRRVEQEYAVSFLTHCVAEHAGDITILAVGRMTNIALAIQSDDRFASKVKEIIFMGGAAECEGNVTPFAEANIIGDPEAADIVFRSGIPLVMVGLDVTMKTCFDNVYLEQLCADFPASLRDMVLSINAVYADYHKSSMGWDKSPVHDSSAIAYADRPELFKVQRGKLNCVLTGEQRGRTVFKTDPAGTHLFCAEVSSSDLRERYREVVTGQIRS